MTELKARDVPGFMRNPDLTKTIFLIYGADRGLVRERAEALIKETGIDANDPFAAIRLDASIASQDDKLVNEAYSVPMFAGKRVIRLLDIGNDRAIISQLNQILSDPPNDCVLVVETGELKKSSALRQLIEKHPQAISIPCFNDGPQSVYALIDETFDPAKRQLEPDAKQFLAANLSGDRGSARSELEKLSLYARDANSVTLAETMALIGDAAENDISAIVDSVLIGSVDRFDAAFHRYCAAGSNITPLLLIAQRQFIDLAKLRHEMDSSRKNASSVVASARPPIFFNRRKNIETALSIWTAPAITQTLQRLRDVVLQTRTQSHLAENIAHICLLGLTIAARRRR